MAAKIITIAQQKGGAGKTTLAAQLAVALAHAGARVAAIDIDPQRSLSDWYSLRLDRFGEDGAGFALSTVSGWRVDGEARRLATKTDFVLVDSPPHAETDARVAIRAADLVLVPVQPTPMDVWATRPTLDMARDEKSSVILVLNRMPPRGRLAEQMTTELARQQVPIADTRVGNRAAFAASLASGRGVVESERTGTAATEIAALAAELRSRLG